MQRVDGFYLYQVGSQIHPLTDLADGVTWAQIHSPAYIAQGALEPLISRTVFQLRTSVQSGTALLNVLRHVNETIMDPENTGKYNDEVDGMTRWRLRTNLAAFEAVLAAELALIPLYVVNPKGGLVLTDLIDQGWVCFPSDLGFKVPEATADLNEATKCIAFELLTASGFHLHRANETVLRAYFKAMAPPGMRAPKSRNMGDYLKVMTEKGIGEPKVIAALTQLKDLHRNPLMHPEDKIENVDEALSLMGAVRSAIGEMLKAIPNLALVGGLAGPAPTSHSAF
jgi:hypothetical protein